ncbi:MAG: flagellar export protein FliJ [Dehalococcoidia bacterium]
MPTHGFRLGQVLEHRRRIEEQRELALQQLLAAEDAQRREVEALCARLDAHLAATPEATRGVVAAADLEAASLFVTRLQAQLVEERARLAERTSDVEAGRAALREALQERRALELLQERQESAARLEADRREMRAIDDLNAARFEPGGRA